MSGLLVQHWPMYGFAFLWQSEVLPQILLSHRILCIDGAGVLYDCTSVIRQQGSAS